jgi:hypothetical protein
MYCKGLAEEFVALTVLQTPRRVGCRVSLTWRTRDALSDAGPSGVQFRGNGTSLAIYLSSLIAIDGRQYVKSGKCCENSADSDEMLPQR